jgi:UDPglucose 6-dehydrogenase
MRDASSLVIVPELHAAGVHIVAHDPEVVPPAPAMLRANEFADSAYACLTEAEAAVIITTWVEFRALALVRMRKARAKLLMVDVRNIYSTRTMKALGFQCVGGEA